MRSGMQPWLSIARPNATWPPYGFIMVGNQCRGVSCYLLKLQGFSVKELYVYMPTILWILEGVKENWALMVKGHASLVPQEPKCSRLNRLWSAEPLQNRKYNRKGQRLIPSNAILKHTYISLGIYFGKTIPIISYPPLLSFSTPIWETSV